MDWSQLNPSPLPDPGRAAEHAAIQKQRARLATSHVGQMASAPAANHWLGARAMLVWRDGCESVVGEPDGPAGEPLFSWVERRSELVCRARSAPGLRQEDVEVPSRDSNPPLASAGVDLPLTSAGSNPPPSPQLAQTHHPRLSWLKPANCLSWLKTRHLPQLAQNPPLASAGSNLPKSVAQTRAWPQLARTRRHHSTPLSGASRSSASFGLPHRSCSRSVHRLRCACEGCPRCGVARSLVGSIRVRAAWRCSRRRRAMRGRR